MGRRESVTPYQLRERQRAVIALFCTEAPPAGYVGFKDKYDDLQNWIGPNLKCEFCYMTSIAVMEAAEALSTSAIDNGDECLEDDCDD